MTSADGIRPAPRSEPQDPDPRRWKALSVGLVVGFMTLLDVSIVNVALPSIRDQLGATPGQLGWIVSGYALALGLLLVPAGRLGDARGRRSMFVLGLALFVLASGVCGLAPTAEVLIAARLAQGFAGGLLTPQVPALIQALFQGAERGRAFGLFGVSVGLSTAVGPLLGGVLLSLPVLGDDAWRWVFWVNIPIGLVALPLALRWVPADRPVTRRESLDPVGVLLLAGALLLVLLPLLQGEGGQAPRWWMMALGVLLLGVFLLWERLHRARGNAPVVDLTLFRVSSYAFGVGIGVLYFAGFTSIFYVTTVFLQTGLDYTPLQAGLTITPFALAGALAAGVVGRHVQRWGRWLVIGGLALSAVGLVVADVVVAAGPEPLGVALAASLAVAGLGSGLVITPNQTRALSEVPVRGGGSAAAVLQTGQRVGTAVGIAVVSTVFFGRLGDPPDWSGALVVGYRVVAALLVAALLVAVAEALHSRRSTVAAARPDDSASGDGPHTADPATRTG